jgi:uncharacterized protein YbaA (DUF1428 family)
MAKKVKEGYVDGFVLVVPKNKVNDYKKMARIGAKTWKKYGALDYKECMIEHVKPQGVTMTFSRLTKAKPGDTVWFSFVTYKSRKHRDQVNAKVMKEMQEIYDKKKDTSMPFDMKKMAYAGFKVIVD